MSSQYIEVKVRMKLSQGEDGDYTDYPPEQAAYKVVREALDEALFKGTNADYNIDLIEIQAPKGDWDEVVPQKHL